MALGVVEVKNKNRVLLASEKVRFVYKKEYPTIRFFFIGIKSWEHESGAFFFLFAYGLMSEPLDLNLIFISFVWFIRKGSVLRHIEE